jgi:hypothetical protein
MYTASTVPAARDSFRGRNPGGTRCATAKSRSPGVPDGRGPLLYFVATLASLRCRAASSALSLAAAITGVGCGVGGSEAVGDRQSKGSCCAQLGLISAIAHAMPRTGRKRAVVEGVSGQIARYSYCLLGALSRESLRRASHAPHAVSAVKRRQAKALQVVHYAGCSNFCTCSYPPHQVIEAEAKEYRRANPATDLAATKGVDSVGRHWRFEDPARSPRTQCGSSDRVLPCQELHSGRACSCCSSMAVATIASALGRRTRGRMRGACPLQGKQHEYSSCPGTYPTTPIAVFTAAEPLVLHGM